MKKNISITDRISILLAILSFVFVASSLVLSRIPGDTDRASSKVERILSRRMDMLFSFARGDAEQKIPDDMVIYRYENDTLKAWQNQFPIVNDDITSKIVFKRLLNPRRNLQSPLAEVSDSVSFMNLGSKWYLVRRFSEESKTVITGLEVMNTMDSRSFNGVNPRLHLGRSFFVKPLSTNGGSPVCYKGVAQFKVICETLAGGNATESDESRLIWAAYIFFVLACFLALVSRPRALPFAAFALAMLFVFTLMYSWSFSATSLRIFSPLLFAGGKILHSLGAVIIINILVISLVGGLYMVREDLRSNTRLGAYPHVVVTVCVLLIVSILFYVHSGIKSIIMNSNIQLEIYDIQELSWWSLIVYVSFLSTLMSVPLLLKVMDPEIKRLFGREVSLLSGVMAVLIPALISVFVVTVTSVHGMRKEEDKVEVWANRLAVDRDIILELRLRRMEKRLSGDKLISSLSILDDADNLIRNFITENYFQNIQADYDINVFVAREGAPFDSESRISEVMKEGVPLADGSSFLYRESRSGLPMYAGIFLFMHEQYGLSRVLVQIDPRYASGDRGYMLLLGNDYPGRIRLPAKYSYARYKGASLHNYKGNFPYPVTMDEDLEMVTYSTSRSSYKSDGFRHFVNVVSDGEAVIISRPEIVWYNYVSVLFFLFLVSLSFIWSISDKCRKNVIIRKSFKSRLIIVEMATSVFTLVTMAVASVLFMYSRNKANINTILSDKIHSLQAMVQDGAQQVEQNRARIMPLLETAATNSGSDLSLFWPDGRLMISTAPDVYERYALGNRVDQTAYENIMHKNKRYFINRESLDNLDYYCMYAPVLGADGQVLAIISSPYTGSEIYDFEIDATKNLIAIVTLFLILLLIARASMIRVLERMFNPLEEVGSKIAETDLDRLELISYDEQDEVAVLVNAYNGMVTQLSENTRKLAQAERDKAWSGMARQVAHEIKNPLTPMKLQLQRIIRLKSKGGTEWQDKFDEMSKVILDHIDILTDTANEFSTFAKLYTEEQTRVNLDEMLQEEIAMFDNRDNVHFSYMGFEGASSMAPKPQLTRVFVNLISNAVQAVETQENGEIMVSLRNSLSDGYFDIVVEDNGPGVSEDNISRLFTPNFTTKNGGSGLGLAISRSILERCDATIEYCKSFHLGGACFIIRYPKK